MHGKNSKLIFTWLAVFLRAGRETVQELIEGVECLDNELQQILALSREINI